MKLKLIVSIFALTLLLGCSDQTDPIDETSANETIMRGQNKPLKINGNGTFAAGPNINCTDYLVQIDLSGSGNATLIGLFSAELTWCWSPPTNELYISGVITAANGDEINIESTGQGIGENGEVYESYVMEGGTGRFADAYGEINLYTTTVFETEASGTWTNYGEGFLSY